jgi:PAS domain S-box-containing protein
MTEKNELKSRKETIPQEKSAPSPEHLVPMSVEESWKMVNELRANQIEITLQNEELRRTRLELDSARKRYFDLFDMAPVGYLSLNDQGLILEANFTAAGLLGVERTAMVNQPLTCFIHPDDQDIYYHHRKELFETGRPQTCDIRMVRADGESFWVILNAVAGQDPDGVMICRVILSENSERKQMEEALYREKNFIEALLESIPGYLYVYDDQGNLIKWNKKHEEMTGYSSEELSHMTIPKWFEEEDTVRVAAAIEKVLETGYGEVEAPLLMKSGEKRLTHFTGARLTMNGNTYFTGVGIDITERKRAEEALRASEGRYRVLIDLAVDGILLGSHEGIITEVNKYMCKIVGMAREDFIGKHISDLPFTKESIHKNPLRFDLLEKGEIVISERMFIRPNGSKVSVEMRTKMMPDGTYQSIYRDITKRKALEKRLRQANKMESVGRLAGGVAHDFNNMLGVILGFVELALEKINPTDSLHADLMEIRKAAQRSANLTQQLLTFARKQPIAPIPLDLNKTLTGMLKTVQHLLGDNVVLAWQLCPDLCPVNIDPLQIDQTLTHLLANSRDAITGDGKVTIKTESLVLDEYYCAEHAGLIPGEYVVLTVSDNGCGMDKETMDKLYEPFFTTKEKSISTGLGLSTVYGVVKQNNGFIYAHSEPSQGTSFKIYLPRHTVPIGQAKPQIHSAPEPLKYGQETILLVDDEPSVLKVTEMILARLGYNVLATNSPNMALRLAGKHAGEIDLLMTDVVMPEMNGRDLSHKLLSLFPDLKRLFMSGYTADIISHKKVSEKGVYFIQKPFLIESLATKVREVLDAK